MGIVKDFMGELSKSAEYAKLKAATESGDGAAAQLHTDTISKRVYDFALQTGSRLSGYDMQAIQEHDGLTPAEELTYFLMNARQKSHIQNPLSGFRDALYRQAEKFVPEWYQRGMKVRI